MENDVVELVANVRFISGEVGATRRGQKFHTNMTHARHLCEIGVARLANPLPAQETEESSVKKSFGAAMTIRSIGSRSLSAPGRIGLASFSAAGRVLRRATACAGSLLASTARAGRSP